VKAVDIPATEDTLRRVVEFTGTLLEAGGGGHAIELPFDASDELGSARPRVRGTVNGTPLSTRLAVYGGRGYLGVRKEIMHAAKIRPGDAVEVVLELDEG
jgi:Domain of unknown function (DUF1905)